VIVPVFRPAQDSTEKSDTLSPEKYTAKERRNLRSFSTRHLQVDTTLKSAYMMLSTFSNGNSLRRFFKSSFKNINKLGIRHLVIDVRSNGGGEAGNSTLLTQYLTDHNFVIADSLYAIKRTSKYRDNIRFQPIYWLITSIITKKKSDGYYHFGFYERHEFKPIRKNHFDGNIYILTGGNSFSATTLFAEELKGQKNVKIIGEETGGGSYGNTAWIIPELTLPNTKLRVGIPKFRFVMRRNLVKEGRGVMPDIYVAPTADDIKRGIDVKIEKAKQLILEANKAN
jgi:C-terminal processing protease CtpA/Prc